MKTKEIKVFFEITDYCNYKCEYCFAHVSRSKDKRKVIPFDVYRSIIDGLSTINADISVLLEGGEPLSLDIIPYCAYAKSRVCKVALGTNASLITKLSQDYILRIKRDFNEVSVGFDTIDPVLYKNMTGVSIINALNGISTLLNNDIEVKICAVITKNNTDIESIIEYCEQNNIRKLRFYWFIPRENNDHSLIPSEDDYLRITHFLSEYSGSVNVKINRYYTPFSNLVVSPCGEVLIASDDQRRNMISIGNHNTFISKLNSYFQ